MGSEMCIRDSFVIIVADDMGYGDVGIYGNEYIKTPNIDQMAREGMMFTDFHSETSSDELWLSEICRF